jgi:carbonic anhydrase
LPAVSDWLKQAEATRRIIGENYADTPEPEKLTATVKENVLVQLENLRTHPAVASALQRGDLHLHGWVYEIETGRVYGFDPANGQFLAITTQQAPAGMTGRPGVTRGI